MSLKTVTSLLLLLACLGSCWSSAIGQEQEEPPLLPPVPETPPAKPKIKKRPDGRFELGTITFDKKTRTLSFPAKVNKTAGLVEFAIVHEFYGKVHESVLATKTSAFNLNVAMLLLGYKPDPELLKNPDDSKTVAPTGNCGFNVTVTWTEKGKGSRTTKLEKWIQNMNTKKVAANGPWTHTGSYVEPGSKRFAAELDGSILAIYQASRALANNPRAGRNNDEIWHSAESMPPIGTSVTVTFIPTFKPTPPPRT